MITLKLCHWLLIENYKFKIVNSLQALLMKMVKADKQGIATACQKGWCSDLSN